MSEREQEIRVSLHADKMLRMALDNKNKIMEQELKLTDEVNDILQYIIDFEYQRMSSSGQLMIDELIEIINR